MQDSLTTTRAAFLTYVYYVPEFNKWIPNPPNEATLSYAAVGQVADGVTAVNETRDAVGLSIRVGMNPASIGQGVQMEIGGRPGRTLRLDILDVTGRRRLRMVGTPPADGRLMLRWDGRDNGGRRLPPGKYFYRV